MKKATFFITLLFLSFGVFSYTSVYTTQDNTALRLDKTPESKLLKSLPKDAKLHRITMHYSGWSQVDYNGLNGWVLSQNLTHTTPKNTLKLVLNSDVKSDNNKYLTQVENLKKSLKTLQLENKALSSRIADIKALNAESVTKNTADLSVLEQQNIKLSTHNNDLQSQLDSIDTDNNLNTLFILMLGLVVGLIVSAIIARFARRKRDSFNTISRPY